MRGTQEVFRDKERTEASLCVGGRQHAGSLILWDGGVTGMAARAVAWYIMGC